MLAAGSSSTAPLPQPVLQAAPLSHPAPGPTFVGEMPFYLLPRVPAASSPAVVASPAAPAAADAAVLAEVAALRAEIARLRVAAAEPADASAGAAVLATENAALRAEMARMRAAAAAEAASNCCPICMEEERPRNTALPCGHTYCAPCVAGLPTVLAAANSGGGQATAGCDRRECPTCRLPFSHTTRLFL